MDKPANSIYLGNIDPNNDKFLDPLKIRRQMMNQLLIWDSIVLSDSQYLTDPRIHLLMEHYQGPVNKPPSEYAIGSVSDWQKGFERFVRAGLVEVAHRKHQNKVYTLQELWTEMEPSRTVPFLPQTNDYASYLDTLHAVHRDYDLEPISDRFRRNLLAGVRSKDFKLSKEDETDQRLLEMFRRRPVYFRYIHDLIKQQREKQIITQERYKEIYDYVFSCYCVNISAETDCYISSKVRNIPLHLDSGIGNVDDPLAYGDQSELRPTWALSPELLDLVSIDEFIDVRKEVGKTIDSDDLVKYYTGILTREEWRDFCGNWEVYTRKLEACLCECLRKDSQDINVELADRGKITQRKVVENGAALVISAVSCVALPEPLWPVSIAAGVISTGFAVSAFASDKRRQQEEKPLRERRDRIKELLSSHAGSMEVITKYGP